MKKLTIRIPDDVHEQLLAYAKAQHRSLQAQLLVLIEEAIRAIKIPERNARKSS